MYSGVFKDGAPHKCLGALAAHAQCKLLREWRARYSSKVHTGKGQRDLLPNRGHVLGHKGGGQNDGARDIARQSNGNEVPPTPGQSAHAASLAAAPDGSWRPRAPSTRPTFHKDAEREAAANHEQHPPAPTKPAHHRNENARGEPIPMNPQGETAHERDSGAVNAWSRWTAHRSKIRRATQSAVHAEKPHTPRTYLPYRSSFRPAARNAKPAQMMISANPIPVMTHQKVGEP
jgi:hypothetical protein